MSLFKTGLLLLIFSVCGLASFAQTVNPADKEKAEQVLSQKDISEEEIKAKLLQKGIDLDNLQPSQLSTIEFQIQQAIREIEMERGSKKTNAETEVEQPKEKPEPKKEEEKPKQEEVEVEPINPKDYMYGHHLFFNQSIEHYTNVKSNAVPGNYVLDAGDKLAINIFGTSQADLLYEIEEDGFIRPSGLYKIYLRGVDFNSAKELLSKRFALAYRFQKDQFNVSLESARTINVNIYGEVNHPGSYTISALNNVFNALIVAGGPNKNGSIRNIKVINNGKERIVDFYDYLSNPERSGKLGLASGDVIFLPKIEKIVATKGNAFKDGAWTYELKEKEHFNDLMRIVGNIDGADIIQTVQLKTREGEKLVVRDYSLKDAITKNLKLTNKDFVTINQSTYNSNNYYTVKGAVRRAGNYELLEGDRISTAMEKAVLEKETFAEVAYLTRTNEDGTAQLVKIDVEQILNGNKSADLELQELDELSFFLKSSFVDTFSISITGAVRDAQKFTMSVGQNYTLYDLIFLAKGFKSTATDFGFVVSKDVSNTNNTGYKIVNLKKAFEDPSSSDNILLSPGDKIVVPDNMQYSEEQEIQISGAVRRPGTFPYTEGIALKELIVLGGGLKLEAATNKIDIYRLQITDNEPTVTLSNSVTIDRNINPLDLVNDIQLQPFDHVVIRSAPEFEQIQYVTIKGEVKYPGIYALLDNNERISDIIKRAEGLTEEAFPEAGTIERRVNGNSGKVVTRIDKAVHNNKRHNLVVKSGDVITIPKTVDVISIDRIGTNTITDLEADKDGAIDSTDTKLNVQINYKPRRAKWYINKFGGGFSKDAKRSLTKVIYPNGQVKRTLNLGIVKIYPRVRKGSEIRLVLKEDKELSQADQKDRTAQRRERIDRIIDSATAILTLTTTAITTIILSNKL